MMTRREIIASAIANARGGRRGVPPVVNVLEMLPAKLRDEVLDDAAAVERAMTDFEITAFRRAVDELAQAEKRLRSANDLLGATNDRLKKTLSGGMT